MKDKLLLKNCTLLGGSGRITSVLIEGGIIKDIGNFEPEPLNCEVIDAQNNLAVPGLIDVHIQGAGGADVLDNSKEALQTIAKTLAQTGTTSYLGTTVVKPALGNQHLKLSREYVNKDLGGAQLLGFHLEGPFINEKKKGGLSEKSIYPSSPEALDEILEVCGGTLKMMTIAPELPGNHAIIKKLIDSGTIPAFAHSDAGYAQTKEGFKAGINHVTHIFNAMNPVHHRKPGPITAIFESSTVTAQIISDGHHLDPAIVNLIYRNIGAERCVVITDGMHGIGLPEGKYVYNGKDYISKDGAAKYLDGTLIGSTMSLLNIVFKFKEFTGCSLETAVQTASLNAARVLGIEDRKGSIAVGKDADIVLINDNREVLLTLVNGKPVYRK